MTCLSNYCKNIGDLLTVFLCEVQIICVLSSWCHCHAIISCFIKIQIGLTFLELVYPGCPEKEAVKNRCFFLGPMMCQLKIINKLECGPMPNVMVALPNTGSALYSTPQSLADAHY